MIFYKKTNNKGADRTARMRRLVCACVDRKTPEDRFSHVEAKFLLLCCNKFIVFVPFLFYREPYISAHRLKNILKELGEKR